MPGTPNVGGFDQDFVETCDDEVSLLHAPRAVSWHVSKCALPKKRNATDSTDEQERLNDDLFWDDSEFARAHRMYYSDTCHSQGAEADGEGYDLILNSLMYLYNRCLYLFKQMQDSLNVFCTHPLQYPSPRTGIKQSLKCLQT